jgi:hypothetical protein
MRISILFHISVKAVILDPVPGASRQLFTGISFIVCVCFKVRFHHHIFATNLLTNLRIKPTRKQMSHIFDMLVSQKFVANQIGLPQTH